MTWKKPSLDCCPSRLGGQCIPTWQWNTDLVPDTLRKFRQKQVTGDACLFEFGTDSRPYIVSGISSQQELTRTKEVSSLATSGLETDCKNDNEATSVKQTWNDEQSFAIYEEVFLSSIGHECSSVSKRGTLVDLARRNVVEYNISCFVFKRRHQSEANLFVFQPMNKLLSDPYLLKTQYHVWSKENCIDWVIITKQRNGKKRSIRTSFKPVFLNLFLYGAHKTFGKNCAPHYHVSIGNVFVDMNKHTLFYSIEFIPVCNLVRILLLSNECLSTLYWLDIKVTVFSHIFAPTPWPIRKLRYSPLAGRGPSVQKHCFKRFSPSDVSKQINFHFQQHSNIKTFSLIEFLPRTKKTLIAALLFFIFRRKSDGLPPREVVTHLISGRVFAHYLRRGWWRRLFPWRQERDGFVRPTLAALAMVRAHRPRGPAIDPGRRRRFFASLHLLVRLDPTRVGAERSGWRRKKGNEIKKEKRRWKEKKAKEMKRKKGKR